MGHGIVLNRIVLYYGSGKVLRCTIGYTGYTHQISIRTSAQADTTQKEPEP